MLCSLQWMICHLAVFKCTLFAYPTQSGCLGSTWLYLYFALLCIRGYFLPSVLLTGSVIEYKKSISYSVQEQQGGWLLFSSFLLFFISLVAAAILAEHKDCYKRGQCIVMRMEKRVLLFTVNVGTGMQDLLQSLSSALAPTQSMEGSAWTQGWPPCTAEAFELPLQVHRNMF